tara:strand:+ start:2255 stop:2758 length:504 start_codon:yes stop_codon:yes gene_type:complete
MNLRPSILLAASVVTILNFQSCSKYEDGPAFSLRTKEGRLVGNWEVVKINGQNPETYLSNSLVGYGYSQAFSNVSIEWEFENDGDFDQKFSFDLTYSYSNGTSYTYSQNSSSTGEWEWENNKEELEIKINSGYGSIGSDYEILKLTNQELTLEAPNNTEWEFEKVND